MNILRPFDGDDEIVEFLGNGLSGFVDRFGDEAQEIGILIHHAHGGGQGIAVHHHRYFCGHPNSP